jgi:hypothetical protein
MSDRGPDEVKSSIQNIIDKFLAEEENATASATDAEGTTEPGALAASTVN